MKDLAPFFGAGVGEFAALFIQHEWPLTGVRATSAVLWNSNALALNLYNGCPNHSYAPDRKSARIRITNTNHPNKRFYRWTRRAYSLSEFASAGKADSRGSRVPACESLGGIP